MKGIRGLFAIGIASIAMLFGVHSSAEDAALNRGLDWLQAQVLSNGSLGSESASLAVVEQARTETAHTLAQAGRTSALPDLSLSEISGLSTELLARRVIGLGAIGRTQDAGEELSVLVARANADGGFGSATGQPSNPLDTSLTLLAMRAGGISRNARAQAALGYLGGAANTDGSYSLGQATFATSYALQAFARFRSDYSLATAIQRTRTALVAQQVSGTYADTVDNAVATIALAQSGPVADASAAVTALRNAQSGDGSWNDDPYVTALALRALWLAASAPSTDAGRIVGEVYDASSGLPLPQAMISVAGRPTTVFSDANGVFVLDGIPAGDYTVAVTHVGYAAYSGPAQVDAGGTTNLGRISLGLADNTSALRGHVTRSNNGNPLAGVAVQVSGPLNTQTQTDAQGDYELMGLPAGNYSIQVSLAGYQTLTQVAELPSRTVVKFSPALTPDGQTPPSDASATGVVVKAADGSPIAGATVQVNGQSATTDAQGRFGLSALTPGAFTGGAQATGFDSISFSGVLANGANDFGRIAMSEAQTPHRTIIGAVTSSATGQPIAGVTVTLNGADVASTDAGGAYRIDDAGVQDVELSFSAAGFQPRTAFTRLENPGTYRIDATLDDVLEGSFQVVNLRTTPSSVLPGETMRVTAEIANLNNEAKPALVLVRLLDSAGMKVADFCGAEVAGIPATCQYEFDPKQSRAFVADWKATNLPAGTYTLALHVVQPGSIQRSTPLGLIYGMASREIQIRSKLVIEGLVTPSPPVMIPNAPSGVDFTATVRNMGNDTIPAGEARLSVVDRAGGAVAHTVTVVMPELLPSDITELNFGHWAPTSTGAEYDLQVVSTNPTVSGAVTGEFYIGDAATGEFTVNPTETAEGNQTVEATLTVKGVNNPTGQAADPLFKLVRAAVTRGGAYTATNALNWQNTNGCLGCHIQTQSLYGLGSSLDKADIDQSAALFLQNSQSATIHSDRAINANNAAGYRETPTILALWSMVAWPDRAATFNARYRMADYLYGRRTEYAPTNSVYWWYDHPTGWITENPAATATVVEGIASVLADAQRLGISQIHEYTTANRATTPARLVDIAGGADGLLYALQVDGKIYAYDPSTQQATLFATAKLGTIYNAIAIGQNNTLYVSSTAKAGQSPVVERVTPTENVVVATLPVAADAIDYTHDDQIIALNRANRSVYLVSLTGAAPVRVSTQGLIQTSFESLTAAPNGSLILTGNGLVPVEVLRDGTQKRTFQGNLNALRDVVFDGAGRGFAPGTDALYEISKTGVIERFTGAGGHTKVAIAGGRVFALNPGAAQIAELNTTTFDITTRVAEMRVAVEKAARHFETYSNYGVPAEAFRLILLSEARPYIQDQTLLAKVNTRIPLLRDALRAAQRADGGWSRYPSYGSDPLTTAIVGTALDYTNPDPTDPVLRKTVQYLLTQQSSDGSWSGQYFSTRLGATSYVMAYLPKAVARLGGIDVGLGLEFGPDVQVLGSSVAADSSVTNADGSSSYFYKLGRINASGGVFKFTLNLISMKVDEWRAIARRAYLRFINSFNGETVEAPIAVPTVHALSKYQLSLLLNNNVFRANEDVLVKPTVRNNGSSYTSGSLRYFIETSAGAQVAELSTVAFTGMTIGTEQTLPQPWNTGTAPAGNYRARVVLLGPGGQVWGETWQPFEIITTSSGPQIGSSVATDKPIYDPFDTVAILGKVRNLTLNSRYENLTVTEVVHTPAGDQLFTEGRQIDVLNASTVQALTVPFNLVAAPAGIYSVTQTVKAADGTLLDTQETTFEVRSTATGGAGLSGTIVAVPAQVEIGETSVLQATARNQGNADLLALPLVVSVIDPQTETVLASWTQAHDLPVSQNIAFSLPWNTTGVQPGDYQAVLQARVETGLVTLAYAPVKVLEQQVDAEISQEITATGRVLVLMTCRIGNGAAEDAACTRDRAAFVDALLTRMGIEHKVVTTTAAFASEFATGRYDTYWVSGGAQKLANTFAEELREAVFQGDGLLVDGNHDSRNQILDTALGVQFHGQLSGNRHRAVMSDDFNVGTFDASGDALRYGALTAHVRGRFDTVDGFPAFLVNRYGEGDSAVAGFDLVAALAGTGSAAQAEALLARAIQYVMPEAPAYGMAGSYLSVRTRVHNLAKPAEFLLRNRVAPPMRIEDARPQAEILNDALSQWRFALGLDETRYFTVGLRLPVVAGTYPLNAELLVAATPTAPPLVSSSLPIAVATSRDLSNLLSTDLDALVLNAPSERNARTRVKELVQAALTAQQSGQRDTAIGNVLKAIDELAKIESVNTSACHVYLASLVKSIRVAGSP
ncbi:carboxypeptidase regulatory-like domain-containing protein [Lysobacter fragariae]